MGDERQREGDLPVSLRDGGGLVARGSGGSSKQAEGDPTSVYGIPRLHVLHPTRSLSQSSCIEGCVDVKLI